MSGNGGVAAASSGLNAGGMAMLMDSSEAAKKSLEVSGMEAQAVFKTRKEELNKLWLEMKKAVAAAYSLIQKAMDVSDDDPRVYSAKQAVLKSHGKLKDLYAKIEKILEWHTMPDGGGLTDEGITKFLPDAQFAMDSCLADCKVMNTAVSAVPKLSSM